jgi:hypothetical protein
MRNTNQGTKWSPFTHSTVEGRAVSSCSKEENAVLASIAYDIFALLRRLKPQFRHNSRNATV